jgi:hypothetical protein
MIARAPSYDSLFHYLELCVIFMVKVVQHTVL